jgi:hypothetical protein
MGGNGKKISESALNIYLASSEELCREYDLELAKNSVC